MRDKNSIQDHPVIYIPPPFFYLFFFAAGLIIQRWVPLNFEISTAFPAAVFGVIFFISAAVLGIGALRLFHESKNTVVTFRPATSLQKTGVYSKTRNPMYLGMVFLYIGFSLFFGNWWHFILLPLLMIVIKRFVIRKEERYLTRKFGQEYLNYLDQVPRWL